MNPKRSMVWSIKVKIDKDKGIIIAAKSERMAKAIPS